MVFPTQSDAKNMKQPLLIQQFDTFHERVDRAFKSMIPSSSSVAIRDGEDDDDNARGGEGAGNEWRTSATLAIRRGSKFDDDDDDEEEENKDDDDEKREGRESDCLFGTKKETRNSFGKCDRLTNEEEFDGDDLIAVGTTNFDGVGLQLTVGEPKKKKSLGGGGATVPDHEKFPLKYTKYSFDEPVYVGGGGGIGGRGGSWGGSRGGRKGDGEEEERRERKKETKGATDDEEKTAPKVEEPRIMRGKKKRNGTADVAASGDKKRTRRVTRSSTMATRSIAAQDAENGE